MNNSSLYLKVVEMSFKFHLWIGLDPWWIETCFYKNILTINISY
jgi:hypothetical protein